MYFCFFKIFGHLHSSLWYWSFSLISTQPDQKHLCKIWYFHQIFKCVQMFKNLNLQISLTRLICTMVLDRRYTFELNQTKIHGGVVFWKLTISSEINSPTFSKFLFKLTILNSPWPYVKIWAWWDHRQRSWSLPKFGVKKKKILSNNKSLRSSKRRVI